MFDFQAQENEDLIQNRIELLERMVTKFGTKLNFDNPLNMSFEEKLENYFSLIKELKVFFGFNFFLNLWGTDSSIEGQKELQVQLLNMDTHQRLVIKFVVKEGNIVPSLTNLWKGCFWCEQETWDMLGIEFEEIPKERLLSPDGMEGFPLRKDFRPKPFQLKSSRYEFTPDPRVEREIWKQRTVLEKNYFQGEVNGPVKAILECDEDKVARGRLEIGFLHRGIEKIAEGLDARQMLVHLGRINMNCSSFYEQVLCDGVEAHLDIDIPERAKALRMVINEIERIFEHIEMLGRICESLGCKPFLFDCLEMRENLIGILKEYSGRRMPHQIIILGGVFKDTPKGWITDCLRVLEAIEKKTKEISKMISKSSLWMDRLCDYELDSNQALSWGVTGPNLRASGVNYDLRKVNPHYFYDDIDFEIPLGINGQCYDRYLVRVEEIFQSISIINQLLDNLPLGSYLSKDVRIFIPLKEDVYKESEALIAHHKLFKDGVFLPEGEFYNSIESPNGELGIHLQCNNKSTPTRFKLRTPSFYSGQCFSDVIEGGEPDEVPLVISSLNVSMGEIDR